MRTTDVRFVRVTPCSESFLWRPLSPYFGRDMAPPPLRLFGDVLYVILTIVVNVHDARDVNVVHEEEYC